MIKKVVLDGLTIHDITDASVPYAVTNIDGVGEPIFRVTATEHAGEDGGYISSVLLGMRPITITGLVRGSDAVEFATNRRALKQACRPETDSNRRPVLKTLVLTTLDDEVYSVDVVVRRLVQQVKHLTTNDYLIDLISPDPQLLGEAISSGQITRPASSGVSFPWVFDPTIEFGTTTGGVVAVDNPGDAATWPTIELRGAMTNPTITHDGSGYTMQLNVTLGVNDVVEIDMKQKTIVLNDTTSYLYTRTDGSNWFSLEPGNNLIRFSTSSSADTGTMEVTGNAGYLGL